MREGNEIANKEQTIIKQESKREREKPKIMKKKQRENTTVKRKQIELINQ